MGTLDGRVAIITGAGRGIGASIARLFAAEGAQLVLNDLGAEPDGSGADPGPAREVAEEITAAGGEAVADSGDVADTATGQRLVELAVERYGGLDVLVNTAGILRDRMIFNLTEAEWDAVIAVHLKGHYTITKFASMVFRPSRLMASEKSRNTARPDPTPRPSSHIYLALRDATSRGTRFPKDGYFRSRK